MTIIKVGDRMLYLFSLLEDQEKIEDKLEEHGFQVMYKNEINNPVLTEEYKKIERVKKQIRTLIFDIRLLEDKADEIDFFRAMKNIRFSGGVKIIFISNREYSDELMMKLIQSGMYNIVNLHEFKEEIDYTEELGRLLEEDNDITEVERYYAEIEKDQEQQKTTVVKEKIVKETVHMLVKNKTIAVVNLQPQSGSTFVALNLANCVYDNTQTKVSYIEYPKNEKAYLKRYFGVENPPDYLKKIKTNKMVEETDLIVKNDGNIHYYVKTEDNPTDIKYDEFMKIISTAKDHETIIVDFDSIDKFYESKEIYNVVMLVINDERVMVDHLASKMIEYFNKADDMLERTSLVYNRYLGGVKIHKIEDFYADQLNIKQGNTIKFEYIIKSFNPLNIANALMEHKNYYEYVKEDIDKIFLPYINRYYIINQSSRKSNKPKKKWFKRKGE